MYEQLLMGSLIAFHADEAIGQVTAIEKTISPFFSILRISVIL